MSPELTSEAINSSHLYHARREQQNRAAGETYRLQWLSTVRQAMLDHGACYPEVVKLYLFGSILQPGRFRQDSDIDVAIVAESIEVETFIWQALERQLQRAVDMRPLVHPITVAIANYGELVYERKAHISQKRHS